MTSKLPKLSQWKQIFKVLKKKEKVTLLIFFALAVCSFIFLAVNFYLINTKIVPAFGGTFTEGVVGQPRFINPIYGETNDIDRSLIDLVFSGLMTYNSKGQIVKDLADSYTISNDGKTYDFTLKKDILWHDGTPLTADDVVFTIQTIQNSDYKSPLRANWIDVDVEKTSDSSVRFTLKAPYNSFLENATVKIIPKHIWQEISAENFGLSSYNLQPIGSGPFEFSNISQINTGFIKSLDLTSNRKYYNSPSFISDLSFHFFENKENLVIAANTNTIDGFTIDSLDDNEAITEQEVKKSWAQDENFAVDSFSMPRYFAVFFNNQKTSLLADSNIRQALSYSVNKDELIKKISTETKNNLTKVDSPILPDFFGYQPPTSIYNFDIDTANNLLDKSGFLGDASGQREKASKKQPAFTFTSYLKIGSKGKAVTQLQSCLSRLDDSFKSILQNETSGTFGSATGDAVTAFQIKYIPGVKPTGETGASTRAKLNKLCLPQSANTQPLKFTLVTVNQPQLVEVANMLKNYWQTVGVSVDVNAVSITDLKPIIKNRSYDALLYGEALGAEPDLYPFWHSSQIVDPGLNLSSYVNKDVDQLLKDAREATDDSVKEQKYESLQNAIIKDAPALLLYNPDYIYWVSKSVQGVDTDKIIDPAKRFENITEWYLQTKRVWR